MALNMDYKYTTCEGNITRKNQAFTKPERVKYHKILLLDRNKGGAHAVRLDLGPYRFFAVCPNYKMREYMWMKYVK